MAPSTSTESTKPKSTKSIDSQIYYNEDFQFSQFPKPVNKAFRNSTMMLKSELTEDKGK